ncbi:hypothetical protein HWD99_06075 [Microbacterium sp. C5A9]|uniref:hypothetical protein n=1 Tax=Microbacterium sp. C5A9 TaxID=2736663 RepID=UPI001F51A6DD|nr:hypothetical protein [Microbacterium sp. C5A9]MCI1018186.1 hypothetical protein [Microbacterium sp. C5A9]
MSSRRKHWPKWSQTLVLLLLIALGVLLITRLMGEPGVNTPVGGATLNLIVAVLALLSAIAVAVGDSISGLNSKSDQQRVRVASRIKSFGHAAIIASVAYVTAIAWNALLLAPGT